MYHIFFICSSVSGHLGCFRVLAIVNSAARSIEMRVSFQVIVLSGYMPRHGIAASYNLLFKEWPKCTFSVKPFLTLLVVIHCFSLRAPITFVAPPTLPPHLHPHSLLGTYCVPAVLLYTGIVLPEWGQMCAADCEPVWFVWSQGNIRYHQMLVKGHLTPPYREGQRRLATGRNP